jgi:hypothetical protein
MPPPVFSSIESLSTRFAGSRLEHGTVRRIVKRVCRARVIPTPVRWVGRQAWLMAASHRSDPLVKSCKITVLSAPSLTMRLPSVHRPPNQTL